jgi:Glycosyltransferase family 9 (heptosyltransferase)
MPKYKCSAIERSPYPVQTTTGKKHVYVITDEDGQTYLYEKEFRCDAPTHLSLATETKCLHCPKCKMLLLRPRAEWGQDSAEGLGMLKVESPKDAEILVQMLDVKLAKEMNVKDRATVLQSKATMLCVLGRGTEMLEVSRESYNLFRDSQSAGTLANALFINGKLDESQKIYQESFLLPHKDSSLDLNYAASLRFSRDGRKWSESWTILREKEYRTVQKLNLPQWLGQPVDRLHVFLENGRGDVLCTMRYLNAIKARGVREIIACMPPNLYEADFTDLLRNQIWMPKIEWRPVEWSHGKDKIKFAVGSDGIEARLDTRPEDVPPPPVFVAPREYEDKFNNLPKLKPLIGIVWAAKQAEINWAQPGALRTLRADQLAKIVQEVDSVQWIKLQFNEPSPMPQIMTVPVESWLDTAGLIANLDAVVTVDTAAMHLAHAMGKPTFVLSSGATNWRLQHADLFFPGAKLFRNETFGFDNAIQSLITELKKWSVNLAPKQSICA